ncbi:hypothetical protein MMG00_14105 [Ignatzschineria rhizosphaerae]|uniref:Uncharacterized protein n=1 Tax=Ignatzschineria rhizosphaerae TaxID=2923279 RepID=A0ABY3X1Z4_9GAMM|nr:hypothetical protein [Ignatzschineria rhizosphaerae]UNM96305.1 hypothetical protein MMG00_14105 [Ignatzschineria rhizosphaerae]
MSNQLYINGKPASLFQRIVAAIIGIGALIFFAFFGVAIFIIGLGITVVLGLYFWWKTRKIRRQINEEMERVKKQAESGFTEARSSQKTQNSGKNGNLYEGEYKEL